MSNKLSVLPEKTDNGLEQHRLIFLPLLTDREMMLFTFYSVFP